MTLKEMLPVDESENYARSVLRQKQISAPRRGCAKRIFSFLSQRG